MLDAAIEAWDPAKHPRGPDGRFLSMVSRLSTSIEEHLTIPGGGHPFASYNREQLRRVARTRGVPLVRGESRDSIAAKLLNSVEPQWEQRRKSADAAFAKAAAQSQTAPIATPSRMTKGQYTAILKAEHIRLQMLDGKSEKDAKAAARPAATIDQLKARNAALRTKLRADGMDYRTVEQRNTDEAAKGPLLDEVQRLASAGGHDGMAKRVAASKMSVPELRKFIADVKDFQARKAERERAQREGAAERAAYERRRATSKATDRQVDYILTLLARRARSGEGGGFFVGPKDRAGIARLSQQEASAYIDSLRGDY